MHRSPARQLSELVLHSSPWACVPSVVHERLPRNVLHISPVAQPHCGLVSLQGLSVHGALPPEPLAPPLPTVEAEDVWSGSSALPPAPMPPVPSVAAPLCALESEAESSESLP